jgi:tetratricopeptide (TPR) repeat protein
VGQEHPSLSSTLRSLAFLYLDQGKYEEVEVLCKRALAIDEHTYGPEHPEVAADLDLYIVLLQRLKQHEEAIRLQVRAQAIHTKWVN